MKEQIAAEVAGVPEPLLGEVLDFVRFIRSRNESERLESAMASQSALAKDWLRPEEDQAWQTL